MTIAINRTGSIVPPGTEENFLEPLPVRAMSGIGTSAEASLKRMGIYTLGQLAAAPVARLVTVFGSNAQLMHDRAADLPE